MELKLKRTKVCIWYTVESAKLGVEKIAFHADQYAIHVAGMRVASTKKLDAKMKGHTKYIARSALVKHAEVHSLSRAIGGKYGHFFFEFNPFHVASFNWN